MLNLSKVNDFRMSGGFGNPDFGRNDRHAVNSRDSSLVRDVRDVDERRFNDDDDIVSDDDIDKSSGGHHGNNEASSDKDRANNNKGNDDTDVNDVDDVDDDDEEDNMSSALGPLAGFQNLLAAAAANGGNPAADGRQGDAGGDPASAGQLSSVYGLIGNIQALLKMAVENAKKEERQLMSQKSKSLDIFIIWSKRNVTFLEFLNC